MDSGRTARYRSVILGCVILKRLWAVSNLPPLRQVGELAE